MRLVIIVCIHIGSTPTTGPVWTSSYGKSFRSSIDVSMTTRPESMTKKSSFEARAPGYEDMAIFPAIVSAPCKGKL